MNYEQIKPYFELLKDHPQDFAYYGKPKDEFYLVYDEKNEAGDHLVISYECNELCEELAYLLKDIKTEYMDEPMTQERLDYLMRQASEEEVQTIVMSIVDSLSYNDYFIECLNNGILIQLIDRLLQFSIAEAE